MRKEIDFRPSWSHISSNLSYLNHDAILFCEIKICLKGFEYHVQIQILFSLHWFYFEKDI